MDLQAACPCFVASRFACGTTRCARPSAAAKDARQTARDGFRSNVRQNAKYRQGYTESGADPTSSGPNDASTRQKLAFPS